MAAKQCTASGDAHLLELVEAAADWLDRVMVRLGIGQGK
jgi:hypothetical protein